MSVYADSSFLVSSCIRDTHSAEVALRMGPRPSVWVTPLNRAEVAAAIQRYVFRGAISDAEAHLAWAGFEQDRKNGVWTAIDLPEALWESCARLSHRFGAVLGVRTLDSLHVACALELRAKKFWTFDERQERLAQAVGLDTAP